MTEPQPQKEYIITPKTLIDDIKIYLRMGCDGTLPNEGELLDAIDKYSRPANASDKEVQVGIHCPLCGFHQTVPEEEWNFQHLHGHGHTCASDKCPSHTYLVLDGDIDNTSEKVLEKIVSDFILKNEIGCPETIYQCDHVIEEACEFIESLCNVVGYFDYDTKELRQKVRP